MNNTHWSVPLQALLNHYSCTLQDEYNSTEEGGDYKSAEGSVVESSNTIVEPSTMMIKQLTTSIAFPTMLRSVSHIAIASCTEEIELLALISVLGHSQPPLLLHLEHISISRIYQSRNESKP
jgi:hypothetical protein